MPFYLDTSAFLKLVVAEAESVALRRWLEDEMHDCWSSQLLVTESHRAALRLGLDQQLVVNALEVVSLVLPAAVTFRTAAGLEPSHLCTLDALHLAAALEMGGDLHGVLTYDARLIEATRHAGVDVVSPA